MKMLCITLTEFTFSVCSVELGIVSPVVKYKIGKITEIIQVTIEVNISRNFYSNEKWRRRESNTNLQLTSVTQII